MRATLGEYLGLTPDIELVGSAASAEAALEAIEAADPTVVLVDLALPGPSGLDLLSEIQRRWQTPCIILSGHGEQSYVGRALEAGARGYILKGNPMEVPIALRRVADGEVYVSETLRRRTGSDAGTNA